MSNDYAKEIGYESLLADFKRYQKQTPRGVGMTRKGQNIYLQFKTPNTSRKPYACNCSFTLDGMVEALKKSKQVKEQLDNLKSEVEFWEWYDKAIKNESQLVDDRLTFGEAIAKVEDDFWARPSRTGRKREKGQASDEASLYRTYGCFYKHLPVNKEVNLTDITKVIGSQKKGSRNYGYVVSAMRKLAELSRRRDIYDELGQLDTTQTIFMDLQNAELDSFLAWKDKALGVTEDLPINADINVRKDWIWVFSTQIVYALRINEVFAIKNLMKPCWTLDGVPIPALNDPNNTDNLIYIGEKTNLGTTVKTGSRIARPQIPPKYPDLLDELQIKNPRLPDNKPRSKNPMSIRGFHCRIARKKLVEWNAPFTQTHADRHLGNINGMQAGINKEIRAMSMGHTVAQNDNGYKKRIGTKTKIDLLLNSNQNAIDFVTALSEAKKLVKENESDKQVIAKLLSIIYQKRQDEIIELL